MAQMPLATLLNLRRRREQAAHAAFANCRHQTRQAQAELDATIAELAEHRRLCREREERFRLKVTGRRVRSLTMELFRLDLESMQIQTELLQNHVQSRRKHLAAAEQALEVARGSWQRSRLDLERIDQLFHRERLADRRVRERLAEDRIEEMAGFASPQFPGQWR